MALSESCRRAETLLFNQFKPKCFYVTPLNIHFLLFLLYLLSSSGETLFNHCYAEHCKSYASIFSRAFPLLIQIDQEIYCQKCPCVYCFSLWLEYDLQLWIYDHFKNHSGVSVENEWLEISRNYEWHIPCYNLLFFLS